MEKRNKIAVAVCSLLGIGFLKPAPGTWGSIAAFLIFFVAPDCCHRLFFIAIAIFFWLISHYFIKNFINGESNDPSWIVIDEAIGMWLVLASPFVPVDFYWALAGLIFFRIFDVLKPMGINRLDDNHGAFWVVADDVLAAFYTILFLGSTNFILKIFGLFIIIS